MHLAFIIRALWASKLKVRSEERGGGEGNVTGEDFLVLQRDD